MGVRANIKIKFGPNDEWTAEMTWHDNDRNGPRELVIRPTDPKHAPPGGVSQTVLREVDIAGAVELVRASEARPPAPELDLEAAGPLLAAASVLGITDGYLALLSLFYCSVAAKPKPLEALAELAEKTPAAIKNHLWRATNRGLLERSPGRAGGSLTPKAISLLEDLLDPQGLADALAEAFSEGHAET